MIYWKDKTKKCGEECLACEICKNSKLCCSHDLNSFGHGCVTWKRIKVKPKKSKDIK